MNVHACDVVPLCRNCFLKNFEQKYDAKQLFHPTTQTFKHSNFVRQPFLICSKNMLLGFKNLNFTVFSLIYHHKNPNMIYKTRAFFDSKKETTIFKGFDMLSS